MLKNLKKGEVIIYVIALMLVAAGYLNYTSNNDKNTVETYSENIENIGEAVLVSNNNLKEENNDTTNMNNTTIENKDGLNEVASSISSEQNIDETNSTSINTSSEAEISNNDYFVNSKLERDTMYANMISSYTSILENASIQETQKSIANQEITKINNNKNAIMICENILSTKGFDKCVIFINEKSVNIVIGNDEDLTTEQVAQIQNVISRELNTQINDIHITQKKI